MLRQKKELGLGCLGTQMLTPSGGGGLAYEGLLPPDAPLSDLALLGPELALKPSRSPALFPTCFEG